MFNSQFKDKIFEGNSNTDGSLRFIDWINSTANGNPKILVSSDFDEIVNSGNIFARKFSYDVDNKIQDRIIDYIKKEKDR